jgi:aryl-alcohol dehydrogenase-like predicted oxidoreductase
LGTTTFSPLASGLLTGKYLKNLPEGSRMQLKDLDWLKRSALTESKQHKVAQLQQLADELGVSLAKLSIAWCLRNPHVSSVILGASRPEQLRENLGALEVVKNITPEVQEKIETVLGNKPLVQMF